MKRTTPILPVALMVAALLLPGGSARAQKTPKVFTACYVSSTGTIYLINEPGLKTQCQNSNHVQFSWIDGVPGYDHGFLNGLADDDHPQYLLADGTRALAGTLHAGGFKIAGLAAGTEAGDAVRYEQAVKVADVAGGDLSGVYPNPSVAKLQGQAVSSTAPTTGQVLSFNGTAWMPVTPPAGITDHGLLSGLADDDHPQYLLADGVRASLNGFAVTDAPGSAAIPAEGYGVRLMWYPRKSAFRAGAVNGTQWNDANVGYMSAAVGSNTTASGGASTAMGQEATAGGNVSTAMGLRATASGYFSTAMGGSTTASGPGSTATGYFTTADGAYSTAMGQRTIASGNTSTAMGLNTTASGDLSTALGSLASTNSHRGSLVYGDASTVGGDPVNATADNSFVVRAQHVWFGTSGDQPTSPAGYFTVDGMIASTTGGLKFPDGTVQTTAASGGASGTPENTPNTLVLRDATGGFAAGGVLVQQLSVCCGATTAGQAQLHPDRGFVVGRPDIFQRTDPAPATGSGVRLMWHSAKAAFRAGTVTGAEWDDVNIGWRSMAMGLNTTALGATSTAMGNGTTASGNSSTAMGIATEALGEFSTAMGASTTAGGKSSTAMGEFTAASGDYSTAMGNHVTASGVFSTALGAGTVASGDYSTATGFSTIASGTYATAMGTFASTNGHAGSFVYGDASGTSTGLVVRASTVNQFVVRASGGTVFYSNSDLTAGVSLAPGAGAWASVSDVNRKENFRDRDAYDVLSGIARMPIREWNYKAQRPSIRHLGPTAQDFYAAFGLGESDTTITTTDADGVALLAIQALERRTRELERENARLRAALEALRDEVARQRRQP